MPGGAVALSGIKPYALLIGLCLLLYLPGLSAIPPLDRDEARFAQATRQMLQTGDWLHIRFQDQERNNKPAGIYWLQAVAVGALSTPESAAIWPYRLPSLVAATAAAILVFAFGAALFDNERELAAGRRAALIAAVLLACALGVIAEAHIAKTDAALLAAVTAGQAALGLAYVRFRNGRIVSGWIAAAFWVAEIAGIMLKGPVAPALAIATAGSLSIADRDARWLRGLRPLIGIAAVLIVVTPWLWAIEHATEGRFAADAFGKDFFSKLVGAQESHGAPPLIYLLLTLISFWPGSLLLVPALVRGWQLRYAPPERFLLAWIIPAWVLLELVPTKLPHYTLPLDPALALLAGAALAEGVRLRPGTWARRVDLLTRAAWVLVGVGLAAILVGLPLRLGQGLAPAEVTGAVLLLVCVGISLRGSTGPGATSATVAALALAFVVPAALAVLPALDRLWLSRAAAGLVSSHPPPTGAALVAVGYSEPSLVFLLGTRLRLTAPASAAAALDGGGEALVNRREEPAFLQALQERGLAARSFGSVQGFDYSNGRLMVLTLYDVEPG